VAAAIAGGGAAVKRFSWVVTVPVTAVVVLFTIGNLEPVSVNLWPLPWVTQPIPLYLLVLVSLLIGFIIGGIVAWVSSGRRRRHTRELADRNAALTRQLDELRREQAASQARLIEASRTDRPSSSLSGL
jgi:lipopolysaccharide assembly protein A